MKQTQIAIEKTALVIAFTFALIFSALSGDAQQTRQTVVQRIDVVNYKQTTENYKAIDGSNYPVFVSSRGKRFITRTSHITGRKYRFYLQS